MTNGLKDTRDNIFSFEGTEDLQKKRKSGDNSGEATPVPISNTEVKLLSADDTWWEAAWESRTLPVFYYLDFKDRDKKLSTAARHVLLFLFFVNLFFSVSTYDIMFLSMISGRTCSMTILKIIFVFLLCVPLLLLVSHFFGKLVDEIIKKK